MDSVALISVAVCLASIVIGWLTKNYLWPAVWSALAVIIPGPAFVGSFIFGLLAVYIAKSRKADATKERS